MPEFKLLNIAALLIAGLLGAWAAWACSRARLRGIPGSDAPGWAVLAAMFALYSQIKLVRGLGWSDRLGDWLRTLAKDNGLYAGRREFQIIATVAVVFAVAVIVLFGVLWMRDFIKRYRLAIGFASLAAGFAIIRFISLHEVDAWNAATPWAGPLVELIAAGGASAVAIARLHQLGEFDWRWGSG